MNNMKAYSSESIWRISDKELKKLLQSQQLSGLSRPIRFYAPSFMYYKADRYQSGPNAFPTISVTGTRCSLNCKHCGGTVLKTMHPATTPAELYSLCRKLKNDGALGCLISGGCLPTGEVPLDGFIQTILRVKRDFGFCIYVHTGVTKAKAARQLADAQVDAALIDIIGSNETIRGVCNLTSTVSDYVASLEALADAKVPTVPHVLVGLHYGKLRGEEQAIKLIAKHRPSAIVIIAFMPIHGTHMQSVPPPSPIDVARVIATARLALPETPLVLGCMRPKAGHRDKTDILAMNAGADAIAFPTKGAINYAEKTGRKVIFSSYCCARILTDYVNHSSAASRQ